MNLLQEVHWFYSHLTATKGVEVSYVWNGPFEELVGQRVFVVDTFDLVAYPDSVVNSCFPEIFW